MAQKSSELELYLQRVRELEDMYHQLEEALEDERQAKQDEEVMRKLQARSQTLTHSERARAEHSKQNAILFLKCQIFYFLTNSADSNWTRSSFYVKCKISEESKNR